MHRLILLIIILFISVQTSVAQTDSVSKKKSSKEIMKDTLDGKTDFSRFLIDAKGFIPVPFIITEPAVGGFGLAIAPVFLTPKKAPAGYKGYIPPDISAAFGMYTANNSWLVGGIRIASIPEKGIKYRIAGGYGDINMSFYRTLPTQKDKEFKFSMAVLPVMFSFSKKITKSEVYLGAQYSFVKSILTPQFSGSLPDSVSTKQLDSKIGTFGLFVDWDKRNNFFTPDKGARINVLYSMNDSWTGSDFTYQNATGALNWFIPMNKKWVNGIRLESAHVFGDPPFYALPFLTLRGVPVMRFQGYTTALFETEQRYDFNLRWSAVAFGGLGKALQKNQSFGEAETAYNYGCGFRYLIARVFKIRAGVDIAKGPDSFGWYIVFGHNWNR